MFVDKTKAMKKRSIDLSLLLYIMNLKERILKLPPYLRNKYSITFALFVLWMLFFDQSDMITQFKLRGELRELENENEYYIQQNHQVDSDLQELLSNDQQLEKFAREKYLMKKDDEDIFVIVKEN